MRTNKTIFVNESVTNIIIYPLIVYPLIVYPLIVYPLIITLNESVNTNFNRLVTQGTRNA